MGVVRRCTGRKGTRCSANIRFFASVSNPSRWLTWMAAAVRRSGCPDYESAHEWGERIVRSQIVPDGGAVRTRLLHVGALVALIVVGAGCAASQAFRNGNAAMKTGDLDQAVAYFRTAAQASPDNPNYKIALQR